MSFCHECGSEIKDAEAYCPICGIALRSPVIVQDDEDDAAAAEATSSDEMFTGNAEPEGEEAAVPGDDRTSDEPVSEPASEPGAAEPGSKDDEAGQQGPLPGDEFVDVSALRKDPVEPVASAPESAPAASESVPEPPEPGILGLAEQAASAGQQVASEDMKEPEAEDTEQASTPEAPIGVVDQNQETVHEAADDVESAEEETPPAASDSAGPMESAVEAAPEAESSEAPAVPKESGPAAGVSEQAEERFLEDATLISIPEAQEVVAASAAEDAASDVTEETQATNEGPDDSAPDASAESESPTLIGKQPENTDLKQSGTEDKPEAGEPASQTTPNIGGGDTDGSKAPKLKPLGEGTVLNSRYEIVRKIGGGGMGAVYLASDKNLGGVLRAVKEMVQSYIEEDQQEKAVQDFKRESMLLTSLEHPSIPTIYDYFFDNDAHRFYLVMKYISGGDLAARLRAAPDGKLDEKEVTEWAIQIADVLDYLHNRQPPIVYRDLKPANIMLDGNSGKVMLIDFGIARWINKEEKGVTAVGTMGYAPPELFSGNVAPGSDIYSLGSTIFHLLTGADPQNNPLLIFDFEKNPRPRQINPRLSDQIEGILMRAVEYNADKRFASAAEMRDALTEHLSNLNSGNVSYGKTESPKSVSFSDQTVFCGFCGQQIVATDMFCAFCGAKQPLAQPGVQSQDYVPVRLTAKLVIEGTSQLDYPTFELAKEENLVGRRDPMSNIFPEVDLSKYDPQTKISRKHARIWREGEQYLVEDLGSSNGTMLIYASNESVRLAPNQAQVLTHGDRIRLGDTTLHFVIGA